VAHFILLDYVRIQQAKSQSVNTGQILITFIQQFMFITIYQKN
jgi:hypothetical protein